MTVLGLASNNPKNRTPENQTRKNDEVIVLAIRKMQNAPLAVEAYTSAKKMYTIGETDGILIPEFEKVGLYARFNINLMIHDFKEEVIGTKDVAVIACCT